MVLSNFAAPPKKGEFPRARPIGRISPLVLISVHQWLTGLPDSGSTGEPKTPFAGSVHPSVLCRVPWPSREHRPPRMGPILPLFPNSAHVGRIDPNPLPAALLGGMTGSEVSRWAFRIGSGSARVSRAGVGVPPTPP